MYESEPSRVARIVESIIKMRNAYLELGYTPDEYDQALADVINGEREGE